MMTAITKLDLVNIKQMDQRTDSNSHQGQIYFAKISLKIIQGTLIKRLYSTVVTLRTMTTKSQLLPWAHQCDNGNI